MLLPRVRAFAGVITLVAVLAACQVDATVDVTMREDGSGEVIVAVVLDEKAAARVPDLAADLRVRDLMATGWEVVGPTDTGDGGVRVTASKPFANVEQGRAVLREVGGRGGALRGLTLRRDHTFGTTTWAFGGRIDLSRGLGTFSDEDLDEVLGGQAFGLDQSSLEQQLGEPLADTMSLTVTARLPGRDFTTNGAQDGADAEASWQAALGADPVAMTATSESRDTKALGLAAVSAGALVLLLLVLVGRLVRSRRRRGGRARADAI